MKKVTTINTKNLKHTKRFFGYYNLKSYWTLQNNRILTQVIIILLILVLTLLSGCTEEKVEQNEITAEAVNTPSCPKGLTNDPAPGICYLYQDENSNNVCDLSE